MTETDPPKIEFPCPDYPIKTMGVAGAALVEHVLRVMDKHAVGYDRSKVSVRDSRESRYQAVTVFITATGEPQLQAIFEDLKSSSDVKMVL